MIITRSPLRISLGGGGTDLPSYYSEHGGFLVSAAIDKYVYITVHRAFRPGYILKYSQLENAATIDEIQHPIMREALHLAGGGVDGLEISSMADIPAGTGLGSSGSFTTALLKALHTRSHVTLSDDELAEQACQIEIERLKEPVGKQDQYISAVGGVTAFTFHPDGRVEHRPVKVTDETLHNLEDNFMLFFTGFSRSAGSILRDQHERSLAADMEMLENLHYTKELGYRSLAALEEGDLIAYARLMDEHWLRKRARSPGMSNTKIDEWYEIARAHGALGGKLIGAGGGGFLLFYASDKTRLRHAMLSQGLQEVRFRFDFEGTKIVHA